MTSTGQTDIISSDGSSLKLMKTVVCRPLMFLLCISLLHAFYKISSFYLKDFSLLKSGLTNLELYGYWAGLMWGSYWLLSRTLNKSNEAWAKSTLFSRHLSLRILFPFFSSIIKIVYWLIVANLLVQYAPLTTLTSYCLNKISSVLIIAALSWIIIRFVDVVSLLLLHHYTSIDSKNNTTRKIHTQILIIKRLITGLIFLLTLGASLMLFDNVRALGASVLTTAGIAGLVITFAAQRSLGSVFAGIEIALTQPIKLGDLILIENELGTVEEINFRSVIIKLWDLRRLSVPTSYFLEKSFQNWSKQETNNLIGSIFLYVDFTLPLPKLRKKVEEILKFSPLWDGKTGKVQVYDLKEQVMQLRIVASARNADDLSALKCEIREKIISYIVDNYPHALPITRTINMPLIENSTMEKKLTQAEVEEYEVTRY
ncbi:mechanosensitive ion channel family protein [Legionella fairfieldensis]|uniref:mechanosensitive ion channel family protein n=1 Tax=Legionella fairfieldensis TaxID=45064 RepID=UPI00068547CD|nr:mechanosensitive ion channel domain-containing protein [Legionella fairfieldensis]